MAVGAGVGLDVGVGVGGTVGMAGAVVGVGGWAVGLGSNVAVGTVAVGKITGVAPSCRSTSETQAAMLKSRMTNPKTKSLGNRFNWSSPDRHGKFCFSTVYDTTAASITAVLLGR